MSEPQVGEMILYDAILPPLLDNSYRMTVKTDVTIEGAAQDLAGKQSFFNIEGPRFTLPATEVGGVFPPRNGHGPFQESIPQIALYRRTLPWERQLEKGNLIGTPTRGANDPPPPNGPVPWLALLVFEENEYTLLQNKPLEEIVPADVFERLGSPAGVTCDAIETTLLHLDSIMPSKEELQLLTHVRQVNVNDRELSAGDSDGYFAVVMSNRLPSPDSKCRACLVSLEERSDLVSKDPPPTAARSIFVDGVALNLDADAVVAEEVINLNAAVEVENVNAIVNVNRTTRRSIGGLIFDPSIITLSKVRLVCLHSWQFACIGPGTFRDLMQRLDVGMIGKVEELGHPALTDTAHLRVDLQNRVGVPENVWYRGPLVPFQLTRDPLGPYHSADQARRATPETGSEDISYASAFEVGRLMAAADPQLAQALMRWRREAYKQSSRADTLVRVRVALQLNTALDLHTPLVPLIATRAVEKMAQGVGAVADPFSLKAISRVVGLNPVAVQQAFNLPSLQEAVSIIGGDAGALGATVTAPQPTRRADATLESVAADRTLLDRLNQSRDRLLENTRARLRGQKI
jgi:hypothetical protein